MNPYDEQKWGVLISGPCDILPAESFEFANDFVTRFNELVAESLYPKATENDAVVFASLLTWDSKEHGKHCPEDVDWNEWL